MIILSGLLILIVVFIFSALKVGADYDRMMEKNIKGEYLYTFANAPKTTMVTIPTATFITQANRQKKK